MRHPTAVSALDVEIDAEVEEGHGDEWREELEGGGGEQKVPRAVKLGETLVLRNDAFSHQQLPEDYRRAVEEERRNPDRQHLKDRQTRDALLGSVPHLRMTHKMFYFNYTNVTKYFLLYLKFEQKFK